MRQQSLSRKIVLAYSLLATLAAGLLTSSLYWQFRTAQRQEIHNRLLELLQLSAPQIDGDYLALTTTADSMKLPFYTINQKRLQNIQAAVPSIAHIYVLRKQPNGQLVFILDYVGTNRLHASVGNPLQNLTPRLKAGVANLKQPDVELDLLRSPDGLPVLYGYAPITNQFGRTNGILVIELNASSIVQSELQARTIALVVFGGVLAVTLWVIWWLSRSLVIHPILQLHQASKQLASGQWEQPLPTDRNDELGDLAASFNQMATQLRESFTTLEQRVQERTYQLQLALSAAKMGNWEWDMITDRQHWSSENYSLWGFCTDLSGRVLDQTGVEISPFPTFEFVLSWVHPDDRDRLLQTVQQTAAQHQLYEIEHRILWDDGSIHWRYSRGGYVFNEQGQPIKLVGISMDITDRKQNEQEIHRSRDLFEAVFQESADAIFLVDPVSLLILDCNQRAVELFEADHKQKLIGIRGHTLHKSSFSDTELNALHQNFSIKGFWSQEVEYRTLKGCSFWGNLASKRIHVAERQMNLVRVTDISERKRGEAERKAAEIALQRSEQNFRTIFNHVTSCLFVHQVDGTLLDVNDRVLERYALEREHALNLSLLDDYSAAANPFHLAQVYWTRAFAGEIVRFEWKFKDIHNAEVFDVDITLNRITWNHEPVILANVLDISERKRIETERQQAEIALRQSEARFQHLAENIPGIFYQSVIRADGSRQFHYVSSGFQPLFEVEPAQLLEDANIFWSMTHPEDVEPLQAEVSHTLLTHEPFQFEYRILAPSGQIKWIHNAASREYLENGDVVSDGVVLDISDRKQSELRLKRQAEADHLLATIAQTINQSMQLEEVLETCLEQIRHFLRCDRVLVCRFDAAYNVAIAREAVSQPELSLVGRTVEDPCFDRGWAERYRQGYITICADAQAPDLTPCYATLLAQMQVQASFVVGILQSDQIWGLMIVHHCTAPHQWQPFEIDLLKQLGLQIGTATQKASLYTQLENQLTQKEVLLKEVNHRVKNNLQMMSAMLWLQSETANNPIVSGALSDTRSRLQAMSLIHEFLYQSSDLGQINFHHYLQHLANNILIACSTSPDQIKLIFRLQPVIFNLETAISCGLLVNELVTNAIKHGFPDRRCGEIHILLEQIGQPDRSTGSETLPTAALSSQSPPAAYRYSLTIQDNGVGIPKTLNLNKLQSLGLKIVYDLARQLDGSIEYEHDQGTLFRLIFPVLEHH